ncbi:MAG: endonuclease III [Actinomycetota bacterium]|nr:endonuclease III [Actinomycetota bacterium]
MELERNLERLSTDLHELHGTPDLGNHADPLDELVYIILSRRTNEGAYQSAYRSLRAAFRTWEEVADAPVEAVESAISASGLARRKAVSIGAFLRTIRDRFGACTLESLRSWEDDEVLDFLDDLPGVGTKSALCVMLYSLGRPVFPVDAHVGRVLGRLGVLEPAGIDLVEMEHRPRQRVLLDAIPPHLRYGLHVNLVVHGRFPCRAVRPACVQCPLLDRCRRRGVAEPLPGPDAGDEP